ncbi:MAG: hypothetical protein AB7Q97_14755 [Gammaproteobacteria bacterium]
MSHALELLSAASLLDGTPAGATAAIPAHAQTEMGIEEVLATARALPEVEEHVSCRGPAPACCTAQSYSAVPGDGLRSADRASSGPSNLQPAVI